MALLIKQEHYGQIEISNAESDIIEIFMHNQRQNNIELVQIEKEFLPDLIKYLQECL